MTGEYVRLCSWFETSRRNVKEGQKRLVINASDVGVDDNLALYLGSLRNLLPRHALPQRPNT